MTKGHLALGKGLLFLHLHITVHHSRRSGKELRQGWNTEAGIDAKAMETVYLVDPQGWLTLLSFTTRSNTSPNRLGPPTFSHQAGKCTTGLPTGQSGRGIFTIECLSSRMTQAHAKLP